MKKIKSFRISGENEKGLKKIAKFLDRSEGWIINMGLKEYMSYVESMRGSKILHPKED